MKQKLLTVLANTALTENVFEMKLSGIADADIRPGQFVNVKTEGD